MRPIGLIHNDAKGKDFVVAVEISTEVEKLRLSLTFFLRDPVTCDKEFYPDGRPDGRPYEKPNLHLRIEAPPTATSQMPPRIRLPAIIPVGTITSVPRAYALRYLSTTNVRRARRSETDEDGEQIVIDLEQQARDDFKAWISGPGQNFKKPLWNEMNYLTSYDRKTWQRRSDHEKDKMNTPFPLNPAFRSHPVLSEELKDHIHTLIMKRGRTIRSVSAEMGVSLERIGAVVRLKEVEKQWIEQVSPLRHFLVSLRRGRHMMRHCFCNIVLKDLGHGYITIPR